jgi:hypothetical protein
MLQNGWDPDVLTASPLPVTFELPVMLATAVKAEASCYRLIVTIISPMKWELVMSNPGSPCETKPGYMRQQS